MTHWEVDGPRYRVYFWERGFPPEGVPAHAVGYAADTYEVTGAADVYEVIAWATANSGARRGRVYLDVDRTFTLYAVVDSADESIGLLRLAGVDPTKVPLAVE